MSRSVGMLPCNPVTLVVIPEEWSIPITAPNDWNQK
jgi:hypothetical protein